MLRLVHELGFANAAHYVADRVLSRITFGKARLFRYYLVAQPLFALPTEGGKDAGVDVRPLSDDALDDHPWPVPAIKIRERLNAGSRCFVATLRGKFAGYIWLHAGHYDEDEVRCTFEPWPSDRVVWDYDVYVAPEYRLTRVFLRLWQSASAHLRAEGFTHTASRISTSNLRSLKAHVSAGATIIAVATFFTVGHAQLAITRSTRQGTLRVTMASRPVIRAEVFDMPPTGNLASHT